MMIYLDNAATTFPKPQIVLNQVMDAVRIYGGNPGRSGHAISLRTSDKIVRVREQLGDFFGVGLEQVVSVSNCSQALNMAIKGVMSQGGHVITSVYEHNSVIRPLHALKQKGILQYDCAMVYEDDEERTLREFERLIRPETKAVVCTHASNVTGIILPVKRLGEMCRRHGLTFIVDAAQSAGVLPIDMKEMNIDLLCVAGHKGLYGITSCGLLLVNTTQHLETIMEGGTGSVSEDLEQPGFLPDRLESGTVNTVGILSMGAGVQYLKRMGRGYAYHHEFELCRFLYEQLDMMRSAKIYIYQFEKNKHVPIVLFNLEGKESTEVVAKLSARGFAVRGGLHCAPSSHHVLGTSDGGAVRVSPSVFNTRRDMMNFMRELKQIAKY